MHIYKEKDRYSEV